MNIEWDSKQQYSDLERQLLDRFINLIVGDNSAINLDIVRIYTEGSRGCGGQGSGDYVVVIVLEPFCAAYPVCYVEIAYPLSITIRLNGGIRNEYYTLSSEVVFNDEFTCGDQGSSFEIIEMYMNGTWTHKHVRLSKWTRMWELLCEGKVVYSEKITSHPLLKYLFK